MCAARRLRNQLRKSEILASAVVDREHRPAFQSGKYLVVRPSINRCDLDNSARVMPIRVSYPQQLTMSSRASAGSWFIHLLGTFRPSQSSKYWYLTSFRPKRRLLPDLSTQACPRFQRARCLLLMVFPLVVSVMLLL